MPDRAGPGTAPARGLELAGLTKTFGPVVALDGATFEVREGEIFGFVGSNGAGKTTAMRVALGVLSPDSGEVRWRGARPDLAARRRIGYLPEERGLYPRMRVGAQLVHLGRLHGLSRAAAQRSMLEWTDRLGIGARRGEPLERLSLGNQQRVQLAAALLHSPELLVLDEPFSGLDPTAVDLLSVVLRERAAAGAGVLFSSHQLDLVERLCDRVGIIRAGRMVAVGTIEELRSTAPPRWVVDAPPASLADLPLPPGVGLVSAGPGNLLFEVHRPGAEQQVLRAALAHGPVLRFAPVRPSLAELYREVVPDLPAREPDKTVTRRPVRRRVWVGAP